MLQTDIIKGPPNDQGQSERQNERNKSGHAYTNAIISNSQEVTSSQTITNGEMNANNCIQSNGSLDKNAHLPSTITPIDDRAILVVEQLH